MAMEQDNGFPAPNEQIQALFHQLAEIESTLKEYLEGDADALVDPASGKPLWLRRVREELRLTRNELERHVQEQADAAAATYEELQAHEEELLIQQDELRQQNQALVTARHEIGVERQRYQDLFNQAPDGYLVTERWGAIREANEAAARMLGARRDHLASRPLILYVPPTERSTFRERLGQLAQGELDEVRNWDLPLQPWQGEPFQASITITPIHDSSGGRTGLRWLIRDVSERKRLEDELGRERDRIESLSRFPDENPNLVLRVSRDGRILYANRASQAVLEFWGSQAGEFLPQEWCSRVMDTFASGSQQEIELTHGGRILSLILAPIVAAGYVNVYGRDITDRKQAEEALEQRTKFLNSVLESLTHPFYVVDAADHSIVMANTATGLQDRPLMPRCYWATHGKATPCSDAEHPCPLGEVKRTGKPAVVEHIHYGADGNLRNVEVHAYPLFDDQGHVAQVIEYSLDITERKQAEERLRQSEQRLKRAQEIAHLGSWELDLASNELAWSDEVYRIFGLEPQEFGATYEAFLEHVHPDDRAAVDEAYSGSIREGRDEYEIEHRVVRKNSQVRYIHEKCQHVRDADGRIIRSLGMVLDITERKRAELELERLNAELEQRVQQRTAELEASEARFRAIFDEAPIGIALVNRVGHLLSANPALQRLLGYDEPELYRTSLQELVHPEQGLAVGDLFDLLATGEQEYYRAEQRYRRKDGETIETDMTMALVHLREVWARFAVVLVEDITERKRAQQALMRSERLAITGRLAASLAHEVNNPLQAVIGCLDLANEMLAGGEDASRFMGVAISELERASRIVRQMRDLNRREQGQKEPGDVDELMGKVLLLTHKQCQTNSVEVTWQAGQNLRPVPMVSDRIQQVFLNLVINAVDAMPKGGELRIATAHTDDPAGVLVTFADTGVGISPEGLVRLFDAFQSTKEEGLGLGLYISNNIIQEHGGRIAVHSEVGIGTTFTVWLPAESA